MHEWMDGWMDPWMAEWMDPWMDGWLCIDSDPSLLLQVLVGGPGPEENAPAGRGTGGAGHLGGVPG